MLSAKMRFSPGSGGAYRVLWAGLEREGPDESLRAVLRRSRLTTRSHLTTAITPVGPKDITEHRAGAIPSISSSPVARNKRGHETPFLCWELQPIFLPGLMPTAFLCLLSSCGSSYRRRLVHVTSAFLKIKRKCIFLALSVFAYKPKKSLITLPSH